MVPPGQKIYHILNADRLPSVLADGFLFSDRQMQNHPRLDATGTVIGMPEIKKRRLNLPVPPYPGTCVGDFVPFYFCSRSIMLYLIHKRNKPGLMYRGGQEAIIHLEADLARVIALAESRGRPWAFTIGNAATLYMQFLTGRENLGRIDWQAVYARDWHLQATKQNKQAEFLVYEKFPWRLIERVGVHNQAIAEQVNEILSGSDHHPPVEVQPSWYY